MNKKHFVSHGDVNLHPISREEYEKLAKTAKKVEHDGTFILARGETTGHSHKITSDPDTLEIMELPDGRGHILGVSRPFPLTHEQHDELEIQEDYYIQIQEREINWFAEGIERKVID